MHHQRATYPVLSALDPVLPGICWLEPVSAWGILFGICSGPVILILDVSKLAGARPKEGGIVMSTGPSTGPVGLVGLIGSDWLIGLCQNHLFIFAIAHL